MTSTFAPHQMVEVRLSASQPVTGEIQILEIKDAEVLIYEGQQLLEKLVFIPGGNGEPGYYSTTTFHPIVGRKYSLLASASGFTPISAESSIPTSIPIDALEIRNLTMRTYGAYEVYDFFLHLDYDDPVAEGDYYDLRISQEVVPFRINTATGDTTFFEAVTKGIQSPDEPYLENTTFVQASILIEDKPLPTGLEVHLQARVDPSKEVLGHLIAELRTVSKPYFEFQRTIQEVGTVYGGISERGVNSYTNVNQGYGLFAGYSSAVDKVRVSN